MEKNTTQQAAPMPVTTPDILRGLLKYLHGSVGLSYREISLTEAFRPIPAGTLCAIANGDDVPPKWHKRLGLTVTAPAPVSRRCGNVHVTKTCTANRKPPTRWADYPLHLLRAAIENRKEM